MKPQDDKDERERQDEDKEREACEEIARKRLEHELNPEKFWDLPKG